MKTQILFIVMIFLISCGQQKKTNVNSQNKDVENSAMITDDKDSEYDENYYKKELDGKYGFRNIKLGMPFKEFSNAILAGQNEDGTEKMYHRENEDLSLDLIQFTSIGYSFYKNILWCIYVQLKPGVDNNDRFYFMMSQKYGEGDFIPSLEYVVWKIGDMQIVCKSRSNDNDGDEYLFVSKPMSQKKNNHSDLLNGKAINEL